MKRIYVQKYDGKAYPSELDYDKEIKGSAKLIKTMREKNPALSIDEAYLLIRNSTSSINTYSIVGDSPEEDLP